MEISASSSKTLRKDRKLIEKNRRNQMKSLYSELYSLLPNHTSKEAPALPDQIDEAVKYIKMLQQKLEKSKNMKENSLGSKRSYTCTTNEMNAYNTSLKSPLIEIHQMGPALHVVLISGLSNQFIFYEVIRMVHEEGAEVVNASFSMVGNSILYVEYPKIGESTFNFGAATIFEKLKVFVHESTSKVEELWDFEIQPEIWEFEIPQIKHMGI
ncbi:transcription factor bHLH162-like isoform X1 [Cornus florida]|uniref:transcription factor bHLH162-like isoform X1 n=1 Tax=Cornus florida TaxID=4283 RepID=UPI0028A10C3F|nr:transcription factor bHLH162-like isoform X1 [Cornus florida]